MSTDLRSANLCGGASENKGAFLFFLENPSKKNYTDGIFKKRLLRKNGPFPVLWRKKFFLWRRARSRGIGLLRSAARRGVGVRGLLRGVPGACGWTRWTAARRGVGVRGLLARRSWASVDGGDGGCACLI